MASNNINGRMQSYICSGTAWTPPPITPASGSNLTHNITLYLNKNAATDSRGLSTRGGLLQALIIAAASS